MGVNGTDSGSRALVLVVLNSRVLPDSCTVWFRNPDKDRIFNYS
jgi:hypothetical protein